MGDSLLREFETYKPLLEAKVSVTYMLAWPLLDENGEPIEEALTKGGMKVLGLCRKNATRHRKEGLADCTITLDGPHWEETEDPEKRALLDHELYHIAVVPDGKATDGKQLYKRDNANRPVTKLRKHDVEVGWFKAIAERHGAHSQERIQAARIVEVAGQFFFPQFMQTAGVSRSSNLEFDADGDRLSTTIQNAMGTISGAIAKAKK